MSTQSALVSKLSMQSSGSGTLLDATGRASGARAGSVELGKNSFSGSGRLGSLPTGGAAAVGATSAIQPKHQALADAYLSELLSCTLDRLKKVRGPQGTPPSVRSSTSPTALASVPHARHRFACCNCTWVGQLGRTCSYEVGVARVPAAGAGSAQGRAASAGAGAADHGRLAVRRLHRDGLLPRDHQQRAVGRRTAPRPAAAGASTHVTASTLQHPPAPPP